MSFALTAGPKAKACHLKVTKTAQLWKCPIPKLAAGASLQVATITGSEDYLTGLPATVATTITGPDGGTIAQTWQWILPYSHLTASWSGLPTAPVDWGSGVQGTLTISNTGNWVSTPDSVVIRPTDPTAFTQNWFGYALLSGGTYVYCAYDLATGAPDGLDCPVGDIAAGGAVSFVITAFPVAPLGGPLGLVASDANGSFSTTSPPVATIGTGADISVAVSNQATVLSGSTFQRTYTVTNSGSTEATGVEITDDSYAFLVEGTSGPGNCAYVSGYRVGGHIVCTFGTIPADSSVTLVATLLAPVESLTSVSYNTTTFGSTTSPYVAAASWSTPVSATVITNPAQNVTPPTLTGTAQVGQTLTATWGSWTGTGPIYLWAKLCLSDGGGCSNDIASTYTSLTTTSGAANGTAFTFTIPASDLGSSLILYVSGQTSAGGSQAVLTQPIGPVTG